jgi:competence protein ComEA
MDLRIRRFVLFVAVLAFAISLNSSSRGNTSVSTGMNAQQKEEPTGSKKKSKKDASADEKQRKSVKSYKEKKSTVQEATTPSKKKPKTAKAEASVVVGKDAKKSAAPESKTADVEKKKPFGTVINEKAEKLKEEATSGNTVALPVGGLNINTASLEELKALPGIGDALAAKIVAFREAHGTFNSLDDVQEIDGIGPITIDKIKGFIKFR